MAVSQAQNTSLGRCALRPKQERARHDSKKSNWPYPAQHCGFDPMVHYHQQRLFHCGVAYKYWAYLSCRSPDSSAITTFRHDASNETTPMTSNQEPDSQVDFGTTLPKMLSPSTGQLSLRLDDFLQKRLRIWRGETFNRYVCDIRTNRITHPLFPCTSIALPPALDPLNSPQYQEMSIWSSQLADSSATTRALGSASPRVEMLALRTRSSTVYDVQRLEDLVDLAIYMKTTCDPAD